MIFPVVRILMLANGYGSGNDRLFVLRKLQKTLRPLPCTLFEKMKNAPKATSFSQSVESNNKETKKKMKKERRKEVKIIKSVVPVRKQHTPTQTIT